MPRTKVDPKVLFKMQRLGYVPADVAADHVFRNKDTIHDWSTRGRVRAKWEQGRRFYQLEDCEHAAQDQKWTAPKRRNGK